MYEKYGFKGAVGGVGIGILGIATRPISGVKTNFLLDIGWDTLLQQRNLEIHIGETGRENK